MEKDFIYDDVPLSESNVSLKLSEIQKRCSELLDEPDTLELTLEEPGPAVAKAKDETSYDPYDRG